MSARNQLPYDGGADHSGPTKHENAQFTDSMWKRAHASNAFASFVYCAAMIATQNRLNRKRIRKDSSQFDFVCFALRFAALAHAAFQLGRGLVPSFVPDVVHAHDWQTGLAPALLSAPATAQGAT